MSKWYGHHAVTPMGHFVIWIEGPNRNPDKSAITYDALTIARSEFGVNVKLKGVVDYPIPDDAWYPAKARASWAKISRAQGVQGIQGAQGAQAETARRVLSTLKMEAAGRYKPQKPRKPGQTDWQKKVEQDRKGKYRYNGGEDLPEGIFKGSPSGIANALKTRSADFQQALSRLSFYMNSSGKNLSDTDKQRLEQAKDALYRAYGKQRPA